MKKASKIIPLTGSLHAILVFVFVYFGKETIYPYIISLSYWSWFCWPILGLTKYNVRMKNEVVLICVSAPFLIYSTPISLTYTVWMIGGFAP
jgi:hypothetical protein